MDLKDDLSCFYCTFYMDHMHKLACDHYICNQCSIFIEFKRHHNECPRNWHMPRKRSLSLPIIPINRRDQFKLVMRKRSASMPEIINTSN